MVSPEYNVYKALFADYNKNVRPHAAAAIDVSVALRFFTLLYMEQKEELIVFSGDFELTWMDPSLVWDPAQYDGRSNIHIPETFVWKPDVTVYNSVGQQDVIDVARRQVTVQSDGTILSSNPSVYTSRCKLNVNNFPFDTQICSIKMSSWVYGNSELAIHAPEDAFNYSKPEYVGNSEWDVLNLIVIESVTNDTDGTRFSELEYRISLKRRSSYYIYVLLVPTFIVSTLCLVGLFTPFDNQGNRVERVTLGLTTLLSLAVMLNIVGDDMPKSTKLPQLGGYVLAEIIVCSIGVLVTIVMQIVHQRVTTRRVLPPNDRRFHAHKAGKMGMRVLHSAHTADYSSALGEVEHTLQNVTAQIQRCETREELRLKWVRVFDTLDLFFLIFFQIVNIILTLCFLLIR